MLDQISERVRFHVERMKQSVPEELLRESYKKNQSSVNLGEIFQKQRINVIAEIKGASPSAGVISSNVNPVTIATEYLTNGACGLSILTEKDFFHGKPENLAMVRERFPNAFILMKDFVIDPYQILQARHLGANAVLLIAALLGPEKLGWFHEMALDLGLIPLVEVHDQNELYFVKSLGAKFIGVNNRNLTSMEVSLEISERLIEHAPSDAVLISESGITNGHQIDRLRSLGYRGFLIGTHLMKARNPGQILKRIIEEAKSK